MSRRMFVLRMIILIKAVCTARCVSRLSDPFNYVISSNFQVTSNIMCSRCRLDDIESVAKINADRMVSTDNNNKQDKMCAVHTGNVEKLTDLATVELVLACDWKRSAEQ